MASGADPKATHKRITHEKANEYAKTTIRIINSFIRHIGRGDTKEEIDLIAVKIIQACERCKYQEFKEFLFTMIGVVEQFIISEKNLEDVKETFTDAKEALKYMNPVVRHTQIKKRRHMKHSIFNPNPVKADSAQSAFHTFYITFKSGMPGDVEWAFHNLKKEIMDNNLEGLISEIENYLFNYPERKKAYDLIEELGEKLKNPSFQTIGDMKRLIKKQYPGGNDYSWSIAMIVSLRRRGEKCFLMKAKDYYFAFCPRFGNLNMIEPLESCFEDEIVDENDEGIKAVKEMLAKNLWEKT